MLSRINKKNMNGKTIYLNGLSRIDSETLNGIEELAQFEPEEIEEAFAQLGQPIDLTQDQIQNGIFAAIGGAIRGIVGGVKKVVGRIRENRANRQAVQQMQQSGQMPAQTQFAPQQGGMFSPAFQQPQFGQFGASPMAYNQQGQQMFSGQTEAEKTKQRNQMLMLAGGGLALYLLTKKK